MINYEFCFTSKPDLCIIAEAGKYIICEKGEKLAEDIIVGDKIAFIKPGTDKILHCSEVTSITERTV